MEKGEIGKSGDGFIDRSKVRILLCDNDERSSQEVLTLLCKCSYQVTLVKSPRQVIDALNAEGPDIDIILSEVDLPMSKGMKMLKYIMRDKELRRIPVITQDEVSIVVKCLKFGAADYLVKPLRTNELLNLWTHMWRRRRMLGLAEKNIVNYDVDLVVSDPSDANTNSTTLFSDDTDEKTRKSTIPDLCTSKHQDDEVNATTATAPIEIDIGSSGCQPVDVSGRSDSRTGPFSPFLKKSELRIGESSAFFMYVKSSTVKSNNPVSSSAHEHTPERMKIVENLTIARTQVGLNIQGQINTESLEHHSPAFNHPNSTSFRDSFSTEKSCTPLITPDIPQNRNLKEQSAQVHASSKHEFLNNAQVHVSSKHESPNNAQVHVSSKHESPNNAPDYYAHANYPYYMSGVVSQVQMQSASTYHNNLPNMQNHNHVNSTTLAQYNHFPQYPPGMAPYPYYPPFGMCLQPGQMPAAQPWQSFGGPMSNERKVTKVDRREAALMKFRQKRKERCFDKKIRYVNRKKLAERRPRVRGQFVRKVNGVNVDLNDHPASAEEYEEDEDDFDEEDQSGTIDLSPDDDASFCPR